MLDEGSVGGIADEFLVSGDIVPVWYGALDKVTPVSAVGGQKSYTDEQLDNAVVLYLTAPESAFVAGLRRDGVEA